MLYPTTFVEELATHVRFTVWVPATCVPVPARASVPTEPELLMALSVPMMAPVADGENTMLPLDVCPGFRASGSVTPETENSPLLAESCVTVTPDVTVLDMEMARVFVVPTFTLPKSRLDKEKWKEAEAGADEEAGAEPPPPPQPDSRTAATAAHSTTLRQPEA